MGEGAAIDIGGECFEGFGVGGSGCGGLEVMPCDRASESRVTYTRFLARCPVPRFLVPHDDRVETSGSHASQSQTRRPVAGTQHYQPGE